MHNVSVSVKGMGGVLKVEKYDYGFRFYFPNRIVSYFVKPDNVNPRAFLVVKEENREAKEVFGDLYANLGVKNMCGLFIKLMLQPEETLYMILGKRYSVSKVHVKDYSERAKDGFDECIFADLLTPQQILDAKSEG
jgi:hypothetical protein